MLLLGVGRCYLVFMLFFLSLLVVFVLVLVLGMFVLMIIICRSAVRVIFL